MKNRLLFLTAVALFITACFFQSCDKDGLEQKSTVQLPQHVTRNYRSVDAALSILNDFLTSNDAPTKAVAPRSISNVTVYYGVKTKAAMSNETVPIAYLVNFENECGFAVLGAHPKLPGIIAISDCGKILDDLSVVYKDRPCQYLWEGDVEDGTEPLLNSIDPYCPEDGDYYSLAHKIDTLSSAFIRDGLDTTIRLIGDTVSHGGGSTPPSRLYVERSPFLTYSWGQTAPYNKYCFRNVNQNAHAATGCSTTALAMIMAYNEFPMLIVNHYLIDWPEMKTHMTADSLSELGQEYVALLMGSIFNNVDKWTALWDGEPYTMITPEQIKDWMEEMCYSNPTKLSSSELDFDMRHEINDMLQLNLPVFISAIPNTGLSSSHSWVIDGGKYESDTSNNYLYHFNFGWERYGNGYFSINCLKPSSPVELDDDDYGVVDDDVYDHHFRVITYGVPSATYVKEVNF
ncbi:MAG: C10 family peptidase [Bacteroidales bacterium]|nr:C10 family peptidase [Bacteroidales bacterium]